MPAGRPATEVSEYATRKPTAVQKNFAAWIRKNVDYDPADDASFDKGLQLGMALATKFRQSDDNLDTRLAAAREKAEKAVRLAESFEARLRRRGHIGPVADEPDEVDDDDVEDDEDDEEAVVVPPAPKPGPKAARKKTRSAY